MTESKSISADFWVGVAAPVVIVAWVVPIVLVRAWALTILWGWYVVPMFGLVPLHLAGAFGLSIIAGLIRGGIPPKDDRPTWHQIVYPFIGPIIALGGGWVGSFFM